MSENPAATPAAGTPASSLQKYIDKALAVLQRYGILPKEASLETLREKGQLRYTNWGMIGHGQSQASTIEPDQVHNPLRWHTEDKIPYDTLVRRAQFYIDHEWFLEAGEELPTHKEPVDHGGAGRRFMMTSGHNRCALPKWLQMKRSGALLRR